MGADNRPFAEMEVDGVKMSTGEFWRRWPKLKIDQLNVNLKG